MYSKLARLGTYYSNAMLAGYIAINTQLWDVSSYMEDAGIDSINPTKPRPVYKRLNCNLPTDAQDLPFSLKMFGCGYNKSLPQAAEPACDDAAAAYAAYVEWCAPAQCVVMSQKSGYFVTMQALAAVGGIWTIVSILLVSFVWKVVCFAERHVPGTFKMPQWLALLGVTSLAPAGPSRETLVQSV